MAANIKDGVSLDNKEIISFLMIGQSNMAGRGNLGEVPELNNPRCYMLRMGRWQPMKDPINVDRPISGIKYPSGVSLAGSFADGMSKHFDREVGIIPCADGGTTIAQWQPGELLYDHALMQCRLAERTSRLAGIIWHQGESDSTNDSETYRNGVINLFDSLRRDLGNPCLPIIAGEITECASENWYVSRAGERLNRIYHSLEWEIPYFSVASAKGLELKEDGIHFNSKSLRIFGERYLEKYINLYNSAINKPF